MKSEAELLAFGEELIGRARSAGADQAEVAVSAGRSVETSLENGAVHTVQTTDETIFGLRVFRGGSLGFSTANALDQESVESCVREAVAQASAMPPDPCNRLPEGARVDVVADLFDQRVAEMTVEDTARLAQRMLDEVARRDKRVRVDSGGVSGRTTIRLLLSSEGTRASEASSAVEGYLFGMAVDGEEVASFDYDGDASCRLDRIETLLEESTGRFVEKCLAGLRAQRGKSFRGAVVLSPEAVGEFLLSDLIAAVSADNVRKGRSPLAGKLGERIAVAGLTVVDDATVAGAIGSTAFDREGVATSRYPIIEDGTLRGFLSNHYEATAAGNGAVSTGHASGGAATLPAIAPHRIELAGGDTPLAHLCSGDDPVIYVGRFSGSTNPVSGEFSGVVKNGFLVEGTRRIPINETLIAGNLFEALSAISAISKERRAIGGRELLPAIRLEGISVTAG